MKKLSKRLSLKELFENNRFVQVFAVVTAALCWLLVAMTQSYTTTEIIKHVPIKIDSQSSALADIGLHPIEDEEIYVDVEVEGVRSVVGQLKPEDFSLSAKLTGVTEAATYDLTPASTNSAPNPDYSIIGYSPKTVKVRFDRLDRKTFNVKEEINGLAIAPGYTEKTTVITPNTINIEGPATELEKISKCVITAEIEAPLDKTYAREFPITLYDANGDVLDPDEMHLTMDRTEAQLMIQVLKMTNLPLAVDFINVPRNFPKEELLSRTTISQLDVTLAGPTDLIDKLTEIQLGYIDVKSITLDKNKFSFDVPLSSPSEQYMRLDNIRSVVVTINDKGLASAIFNVPAIKLINAPPGFDVEMLADTIYNVEFIGVREIFETMTADDIVAEIDLSERELVTGSYPFPVKISVPGKGLVWAVGDHSITIEVASTETQK